MMQSLVLHSYLVLLKVDMLRSVKALMIKGREIQGPKYLTALSNAHPKPAGNLKKQTRKDKFV